MMTDIGRVVVHTTCLQGSGVMIWETWVTVYSPTPEDHWAAWEPYTEVWDVNLAWWQAFIGHALIAGSLQSQYALPPAPASPPWVTRCKVPECRQCQILQTLWDQGRNGGRVWESTRAGLPALGTRPAK